MDSGEARSFAGGYEERIAGTVDGLAIYARDYAPLTPITGLPVICLHGLTRNSRDFEVLAPRIAALGRRVVAADMRGRGRSSNDPDPAHYVPAVYAQDVVALMDRLEIPRAAFVGTSMGGIITMVMAAYAPDRVAAAVLNDIGPRLDPLGIARIASYVGHVRPYPTWEAAAEGVRERIGPAYPRRAEDGQFWRDMTRRVCRMRDDGQVEPDYDASIALPFMETADGPPADLTPVFQALAQKPLLLVRGAISDLCGADVVSYMRELKPDMAYAEVPEVGHAPCLDEPEAWDAILDFLAQVD